MIILVMGLSGAGKSALTQELAPRLNAVVLNGDEVRATLSSDLGFAHSDRVEHARRIGTVARLLHHQGHTVIADFICPTEDTREAFGEPDHLILVDRVDTCQFEDTNLLWERPTAGLVVSAGMTPKEEADYVIDQLGLHDWSAPHVLLLGRYQPWHEGHRALMDAALVDSPNAVIGVRSTYGTSEKDPFTYKQVKSFIQEDVPSVHVLSLPNITRIAYGRDVGYSIEKLELGADLEAVSATNKRKALGI